MATCIKCGCVYSEPDHPCECVQMRMADLPDYGKWIELSDREQYEIATAIHKELFVCGCANDAWALLADQLQAQLAAAEALLREAMSKCQRDFVQAVGPTAYWYDTTCLTRDWFERAKEEVGDGKL